MLTALVRNVAPNAGSAVAITVPSNRFMKSAAATSQVTRWYRDSTYRWYNDISVNGKTKVDAGRVKRLTAIPVLYDMEARVRMMDQWPLCRLAADERRRRVARGNGSFRCGGCARYSDLHERQRRATGRSQIRSDFRARHEASSHSGLDASGAQCRQRRLQIGNVVEVRDLASAGLAVRDE